MDDLKLPAAIELLWDRQPAGARGPRPARSVQEIVDAAVAVADAEGIDAVSMARVAQEVGFSTMALYRYVPNKEALLQLMWNAGGASMISEEIEGEGWRSRLGSWAMIQRRAAGRHPWIARMPIANPPLAPNALRHLERGMAAFEGTQVPGGERIQVLGIISAYVLADVRLGLELREGAEAAAREGVDLNFGGLLRAVVEEDEFPHLHRLAFSGEAEDTVPSDDPGLFAADLEIILDGVEVLVARYEQA